MLRFPRWLTYRDTVLDYLGALLVMYPRGRQFSADFTGLHAILNSHFEAQMRPSGSATEIAAIILGELVQQLSPEQRTELAKQIEALEAREIQALVTNQLSKRTADVRDHVTFTANLIGAAIFIGRRMVDEGTLHPEDFEKFIREVDVCGCAGESAGAAIGA
jgi:hypothetical protein